MTSTSQNPPELADDRTKPLPPQAFKPGHVPWNKGRKIGPQSPDHLAKRRLSLLGHTQPSSQRIAVSTALTGIIRSQDTRLRISRAKIGSTPWNKGKTGIYGPETIAKIRNARMRQVFPKQLTKPEQIFRSVCTRERWAFRYTGDGTLWVGRVNPDFADPLKKLAVDILGNYWHSPLLRPEMRRIQDPTYRKAEVERAGWRYIALWESELKRGDVVGLIQRRLQA